MDKHELAQKIIKILIDSGLTIPNQLKVIQMVKDRLVFCNDTGTELKQTKLF